MQDLDEKFMNEALNQARLAYEKGEVPVGAVLVVDQKIIAKAHNQVELLQDATAHAEMLCLSASSAETTNWRLSDATFYCTLEPCCMCAGALILSRVKRLVWGAPDLRHGANGSWVNLFSQKHPIHNFEITTHVLSEVAADLMQSFFAKRRKEGLASDAVKEPII